MLAGKQQQAHPHPHKLSSSSGFPVIEYCTYHVLCRLFCASHNGDIRTLWLRGVVVRECGGTPFRQLFWSRNGAPADIVGHKWNANSEVFWQITSYSLGWPSVSLFSGPNCPQTRDLASKISKKEFSGDHTPVHPSTATRRARGRKLPRCLDLGLGNRSPESNFPPLHPCCDYIQSSQAIFSLGYCPASESVLYRFVLCHDIGYTQFTNFV